jgi:adenosine deaminase CECR1
MGLDYAFRQSLSPMARMACAIVSKIREEERGTVWTKEYEDSLAKTTDGDMYPGMMFTLAKERMEKTKLWDIVRRMPKGSLLHAHMDAMVDVDWLLEKALATEGMHLRAGEPLCTPAALETADISFAFAKYTPEADQQIWSPQYKPSTLVAVTAAAESFPNGGKSGFLAWLKGRCTITSHESLNHQQGPNAVWHKFASTFPIINSIMFYEPIYRASIQKILEELSEDGVRWVEFRLAFVFDYRRDGCKVPEEGYVECMKVFADEVRKFKNTEKGEGFWGARSVITFLVGHL